MAFPRRASGVAPQPTLAPKPKIVPLPLSLELSSHSPACGQMEGDDDIEADGEDLGGVAASLRARHGHSTQTESKQARDGIPVLLCSFGP